MSLNLSVLDVLFQTHQFHFPMPNMPIDATIVYGLTGFPLVSCPACENLTSVVVHLHQCSCLPIDQGSRTRFAAAKSCNNGVVVFVTPLVWVSVTVASACFLAAGEYVVPYAVVFSLG